MEETDVNMTSKDQVGHVSGIRGPGRCEMGNVGFEEGVADSSNVAKEGSVHVKLGGEESARRADLWGRNPRGRREQGRGSEAGALLVCSGNLTKPPKICA